MAVYMLLGQQKEWNEDRINPASLTGANKEPKGVKVKDRKEEHRNWGLDLAVKYVLNLGSGTYGTALLSVW